jgi:hypothetical protein
MLLTTRGSYRGERGEGEDVEGVDRVRRELWRLYIEARYGLSWSRQGIQRLCLVERNYHQRCLRETTLGLCDDQGQHSIPLSCCEGLVLVDMHATSL